jgi:hypothetical protein
MTDARAKDRISEIAEILALGLTRLMAGKSSGFCAKAGECSLGCSPDQSGDGPVSENGERA